MTSELIIAVIVALIGAMGGGLGVAWLNRDKTRADAAGALTEGTIRLLNELQEERAAIREDNRQLRARVDNFDKTLDEVRKYYDDQIDQLKEELKIQANAIENLNAENLKLQAVIKVYVRQLWERGIEPIINPDRIESITVKELNRILAGYVNIDRRRSEAGRKSGGDE